MLGLVEDAEGQVWSAAEGVGVSRLDAATWSGFSEAAGCTGIVLSKLQGVFLPTTVQDCRFLIVDDTEGSRAAVRMALEQMGARQIDEAANGVRGLDKIKQAVTAEKPYTMVFCDLHMPEMDGLTLLETCRGDKQLDKTPFVMVTTESAKPTVIRAVMSGISGYIVKPFGVEEVMNKVKELMKRIDEAETTA